MHGVQGTSPLAFTCRLRMNSQRDRMPRDFATRTGLDEQ